MTRVLERGATAIEYALLLTLVAAVLFGTAVAFGLDVVWLFTTVPDF